MTKKMEKLIRNYWSISKIVAENAERLKESEL